MRAPSPRLLLLTALAGCAPELPAPTPTPWAGPGDGPPRARHLVLISVDTLRADHLSPYGAPFDTPYAAQLAAEGAVFTRHAATAPTTLASHSSLVTGLWPRRHGVPRNGFPLPPRNLTLAEALGAQGFTTAAFVSAFPLEARFGFDQGFQTFDAAFDVLKTGRGCGDDQLEVEQSQRAAASVTDAALGWAASAGDERLFLFVHYFDPHAPYDPPPAYRAAMRGERPRVRGTLDERLAIRDGWAGGGMRAESASMERLYAAEVVYTDHQLGRLLDGLDAAGILDDALVLLTADHGETFTEHWEIWNHGFSVFQETIQAPLIVRLPGGEAPGRRIDRLTSAVDVLPSALELLDLPPLPGVDGVSFAPALRGEPAPPRPPIFAEATKPSSEEVEAGAAWRNDRKCRMVFDGRHKLVHCPWRGTRALYDLNDDPAERADVAATRPEIAAALQASLDAWAAGAAGPEAAFEDDPETIERLRALGYLEE